LTGQLNPSTPRSSVPLGAGWESRIPPGIYYKSPFSNPMLNGLFYFLKLIYSADFAIILYSKAVKKKGGCMQLTKISPKHQITIPQEAFKKLELEVGDYLEVEITDGGLLLIPKKVISKDQNWFWTKEWQSKEREADEAISRGDISGPFESGDELIRHLKKRQ
jgi:antitoxin MazE